MPDIYALGYSIANESVSSDIEKCLTKDSVIATDDQPAGESDDLASMIAAYNELRHRLSRVESELKARTEENNIMRQELDELKSTTRLKAAPAQSTNNSTVLETLNFPQEPKGPKGKKRKRRNKRGKGTSLKRARQTDPNNRCKPTPSGVVYPFLLRTPPQVPNQGKTCMLGGSLPNQEIVICCAYFVHETYQ